MTLRTNALMSLGALALATGAASAGIVNETHFDTGLDGWMPANADEFVWRANGSDDSGGYLEFIDNSGGGGFVWAPDAWLGDWSSLDGFATISYDHRIFAASGGTSRVPHEIRIAGAGGEARWYADSATTSTTGWITLSAQLDREDWTMISGTWDALLGEIDSLGIRVEVVSNNSYLTDREGIDRIMMSSAVPAPGAAILFAGLARRRRRR